MRPNVRKPLRIAVLVGGWHLPRESVSLAELVWVGWPNALRVCSSVMMLSATSCPCCSLSVPLGTTGSTFVLT